MIKRIISVLALTAYALVAQITPFPFTPSASRIAATQAGLDWSNPNVKLNISITEAFTFDQQLLPSLYQIQGGCYNYPDVNTLTAPISCQEVAGNQFQQGPRNMFVVLTANGAFTQPVNFMTFLLDLAGANTSASFQAVMTKYFTQGTNNSGVPGFDFAAYRLRLPSNWTLSAGVNGVRKQLRLMQNSAAQERGPSKNR
jgi:hypothetical protein